MAVMSVTDKPLRAGVCAVHYMLLTSEGVSRCAKTCWSLAQTCGLWPRAGRLRSKKACQSGTFGRHSSLVSCIDTCATLSFHTWDSIYASSGKDCSADMLVNRSSTSLQPPSMECKLHYATLASAWNARKCTRFTCLLLCMDSQLFCFSNLLTRVFASCIHWQR